MGASQVKNHIYAVPVSEKKQGESQIYRNINSQNQLKDSLGKDNKTLQDVIEQAYTRLKDKQFVGRRDPKTNQFTYKTYSEEYRDARGIGSAIEKLYLANNTNEYKNINLKLIGIHSKNRVEWNTVDMACALYGYTLIPLYDTLGQDTISYIFGQTQITSCFCSAASIKTILATQDLQKIVNLISFDPLEQDIIDQINDLVVQGTAHLLDLPKNIHPETIFTFSYTSGTTGMPKGAMMSHKNFISIIASLGEIDITENDYQLCYLPLPHVLQRIFNVVCWHTGCKIAFFGGDILKLKDDIADSKPTIFLSVPRLFNKFYDVIQDNLKKVQGCKQSLIQSALKTKLENLKSKNQLTHFFYDKLIFNKLKNVFGGRIRIVASGSAPISQEVLDFFRIVLQCPVYEGYGQTEGTGFQFVTSKHDMGSSGYVGGVCAQLEMKLIDVPEMNYFSTDKNEKGENIPRGEICVRGNSVFTGYYKEEEKTKETVDDQGWLHSGDIGLLLPNGSLKIIDRRKNIFKLSQGEYVAPEKVENIYIRARGVQEAFVYGDSLQNYCIGILVPNPDEIKKIAAELSIDAEQDIAVLCQNQKIIDFYKKSIFDHGKANKLFTFEQATKIHLEPKSFILLGLCTSTLKLQRHQAKQYYKQILDQLYASK